MATSLSHFMNPDTYEQVEISQKAVSETKEWLKEQCSYQVLFLGTNKLSASPQKNFMGLGNNRLRAQRQRKQPVWHHEKRHRRDRRKHQSATVYQARRRDQSRYPQEDLHRTNQQPTG